MQASERSSSGQTERSTRGHIQELDGLRAIAILLVLVHHFWPTVGPLAQYSKLAHLGWIGVDLFFVISGFLITGILLDTVGDRGYLRNFYARRALRIFPLYYLFLLIVFTVIPLAQGGPYGQTEFLRESGSPLWYILYLGNVREALVGVEPAYFLAPLWSLSIEEQFYIVFPLLVALLSRRSLAILLVALVLAAPAFRFVTMLLFPANERIQYLAPFSRMDVISLGCLLAVAFRSPRCAPQRWPAAGLLLTAIAAMGAAFFLNGLDRTLPFCRVAGYSLVAVTFACFVLWTLQRRGDRATAWLRWQPVCYLGKICYGIYLLQRPAEVILLKASGKLGLAWDPGSLTLVIAKMATAILLATASWHLFERSVLRLKGRFSSASHPSTASTDENTKERATERSNTAAELSGAR
jgi:peptidoglycan/LPS O-acetylase OafA/YrhL